MNNTKIVVSCLSLIVVIISFAGCVNQTPNSITYIPYTDNANKITINYPNTWTYDEDTFNKSVIFYPKDDITNYSSIRQVSFSISIVGYEEFQMMNLEKYTESHIENYSALTDFIIQEDNATTLSNLSAHQLIFTFKEQPYDFMQNDIWTYHNNTIYLLSYSADAFRYSDYTDIISHIINSYKILY